MCMWPEGQNSVRELNPRLPARLSDLSGESDGHNISVITVSATPSTHYPALITSCVPVRENLPTFPVDRGQTAQAYFTKKLRCLVVKPLAKCHMAIEQQSQTEPQAVCSQSQNSNSTQQVSA